MKIFLLLIVAWVSGCSMSRTKNSDASQFMSGRETTGQLNVGYRIAVLEISNSESSTNARIVIADGKPIVCNGKMKASPSSAEINTFFRTLEENGLFESKKWAKQIWCGPDSKYIAVEIQWKSSVIYLASWHDNFERRPRLFVNQHGVQSRDNLNGADPTSTWSSEYRQFRQMWNTIMQAIEKLCLELPEFREPSVK